QLLFFVHLSWQHRHLPSFPTRRSSDLADLRRLKRDTTSGKVPVGNASPTRRLRVRWPSIAIAVAVLILVAAAMWWTKSLLQQGRSEEHTSELQSPYDLVCRLLPEKKNS